jgi:hypothetical protein
MKNMNLLSPIEVDPIGYTIKNKEEYIIKDPLLFKTKSHIFKANINERPYGFFVKVGGIKFNGCIELFIYKDRISHLAQIYSEPECDISFKDGVFEPINTIEMIKGTLQLCQVLFDVNEYKLSDNSNIDCKKAPYKDTIPPRTFIKPFPLSHLYLVTHCKTWYEYHFNARIENIHTQKLYNNASLILAEPMKILLDELAKDYRFTNEIKDELSKYYDPSNSLVEFVNTIPKYKRCDLLAWLPLHIDNKIGFNVQTLIWIIKLDNLQDKTNTINNTNNNLIKNKSISTNNKSINEICIKDIKTKKYTMERTNMLIVTHNLQVGGKRRNTRYNRKNKHKSKTHRNNNNYFFANRYVDYRTAYNNRII